MRNTIIKAVGVLLIFCPFAKVFAQSTSGTLTFSFNQPQPTSPPLSEGIKNVYAVWIENSAGAFVKTICRFTSTTTDDHLPTWASKSGCSNATVATGSSCNVTDALTGATRTASTTPVAFGSKTITWDGKDVVGTAIGTTVVDGTYKVWIESTWNHNGGVNYHNELIGFSFVKGPNGTHVMPAGDNYINSAMLTWTPDPLGLDDVKYKEPAVVIYPIPSTGIFKVDLKNQVDEIKVYNLLGQTIYFEKVKGSAVQTTKQIDLSGFSNGSYVISLTNEFGTSNYEVVVQK